MSSIKTIKLYDGVFQFQEVGDGSVDSFLILGSEKAVLIDTLCRANGLLDAVRSVTDLPITVLLTHGHFDHVGVSTDEFKKASCGIYMSHEDIPVINAYNIKDYPEDYFLPLNDGDVFDLGGVKIKTMALKGHTPGSMVFMDEEREILFSGDAMGSGGFWLQLESCLSVSVFQKSLIELIKKIEKFENLKIWAGHVDQMPYKPFDINYARDVQCCADRIIKDKSIGENHEMLRGDKILKCKIYKYGLVEGGIWYREDNI